MLSSGERLSFKHCCIKDLTIVWDHFHLFNCSLSIFELGVGDLELDISMHVNFGLPTKVVIEVYSSKYNSKNIYYPLQFCGLLPLTQKNPADC